MPNRAHLWRGIHDKEMVRGAVDIELVANELDGPLLVAALVLRNRDVGHAFPTYVTPRVTVSIHQEDGRGHEIDRTRIKATIGREVDLSTFLEVFDTRVLPGESVKLDYALARHSEANTLVGRVVVDPDFLYRGLFAAVSASLEDPAARALIAEASLRIETSDYVLTEIRRPLPGAAVLRRTGPKLWDVEKS